MATVPSRAKDVNNGFVESARADGQDNIAWLRAQWKTAGVGILLLGGTALVDFRLRVAQSHLRDDLTPSHWSHVALLGVGDVGNPESAPLFEISLLPPAGFGMPAASNGVQQGTLGRYANVKEWPNIAVLYLPPSIDRQKCMEALERFRKQRVVLDAVQLTLAWLGYVWGVGRAANPLLDGMGIPSAAMLEVVTGALGFDLTPGLESRASCPEAIWQSARWWHDYHDQSKAGALTGAFHTSHYLPN